MVELCVGQPGSASQVSAVRVQVSAVRVGSGRAPRVAMPVISARHLSASAIGIAAACHRASASLDFTDRIIIAAAAAIRIDVGGTPRIAVVIETAGLTTAPTIGVTIARLGAVPAHCLANRVIVATTVAVRV